MNVSFGQLGEEGLWLDDRLRWEDARLGDAAGSQPVGEYGWRHAGGPGTNGGEIVTALIAQSSHAARSIRRMMREGTTAVEVKPLWADVYHAWLQDGMRGTAWVDSHNYFKSASGKVVTQWPYGAQTYRALSRVLSRPSEKTRVRSRPS